MSRLGYLLFGIVVLALAVYLFWPGEEEEDGGLVRVYTGEPLEAFTLITPLHRQEVDGEQLRIDGIQRPVDAEAVARFWRLVQGLRSDRVEEGRDRLGAGSATHELRDAAGAPLLSWKQAAAADAGAAQWQLLDHRGGRLFVLPAARLRSLHETAERLDRRGLLAGATDWQALQIGTQTLVRQGGTFVWRDALAPQRPAFTRRVSLWRRLWERLRLTRWEQELPPALAALPEAAAPALSGTFTPRGERAASRSWRVDTVPTEPLATTTTAWLRVEGLPAQPLAPLAWEAMQELAARFRRDELFNISVVGAFAAVNRITVYRGEEDYFRVERDGQRDEKGVATAWSLVYDGHRVEADSRIGFDALADFSEIVITEPELRPAPLDEPRLAPGGHTIVLAGDQFPEPHWIRIAGDRIESRTHTGRIEHVSDFLAEPAPAMALSPVLVGKPVERLTKVQRATYAAGRGRDGRAELFSHPEGGRWQRQVVERVDGELRAEPPGPVDPLAMEHLLRGIAGARAAAVRFATEADRRATATRSLTVQVAPVPADAADEAVRFEDTVGQDLAFYLHPREGGGAVAVDQDGLIAYELDAELLGQLWRDVREQISVPIVPTQVTRLVFRPVRAAGPAFSLTRQRAGWQVRPASGPGAGSEPWPADAGEVQRYLLLLAGLEPIAVEAEAVPLTPDDDAVVAEVAISLPVNAQLDEEVRLILGPTEATGRTLSVISSRPLQQALPGRVRVAPAPGERLWRGWRSFVHPDALPKLPPPTAGGEATP